MDLTSVKVTVLTEEEHNNNQTKFDEILDKQNQSKTVVKVGNLLGIEIIEKATNNKKTAVAIMAETLPDENGNTTTLVVTTTAAIFQSMASALKGAQERFGDV